MINQLRIINFQSHKDTTLNFSPEVNVIIGPSDSGKTAIIRTIKWVSRNRPSGEAFRSRWGGDTEVHLTTETTISRIRGKKNMYLINDTPLEAFKSDVPIEVQDNLKLGEINLQSQLDSPFLLSSTPSEVAQHFNKVANLSEIDSSTQKINSWIRSIGDVIKGKEKDIQSKEEELKQLPDLNLLETEVEVLEQLEEQRLSLSLSTSQLTKLITGIENTEASIYQESELLKIESTVNQLLKLFKNKTEIQYKVERLSNLISSIYSKRKEITEYDNLISGEDIITSVITLIESKNALEMRRNALEKLVSNIQHYTNNESLAKQELSTLNGEYKKLFPNICPLCGQKVTKNETTKDI